MNNIPRGLKPALKEFLAARLKRLRKNALYRPDTSKNENQFLPPPEGFFPQPVKPCTSRNHLMRRQTEQSIIARDDLNGVGSHIKQTQARQSVGLEQPLVNVLFQQLLDLRRGHLVAIGREFPVSLCSQPDQFLIGRGGQQGG